MSWATVLVARHIFTVFHRARWVSCMAVRLVLEMDLLATAEAFVLMMKQPKLPRKKPLPC